MGTGARTRPRTGRFTDARTWLRWLLVALVATAVGPGNARAEDEDTPGPLKVSIERQRDTLEVRFELVEPLPPSFIAALPSGAQVRVVYPVRVRARRRLWWDRRLWKGEVTASVSFDPVTGRYRCELILDEVIVTSQETRSADDATGWLTSPPPVRLAVPAGRRSPTLQVKVRAVFSSSTRWLLFPATEGTDWVELVVEPEP